MWKFIVGAASVVLVLFVVPLLAALGVAATGGASAAGVCAAGSGTDDARGLLDAEEVPWAQAALVVNGGPPASGPGTALGGAQRRVAEQIITEGRRQQIPDQGIVIALAVASQESRFQVYANDGRGTDLRPEQRKIARSLAFPHDAVGTDHGSLGPFQQQWPWWGTMQQLMDPTTSAGRFYADLVKIPGWTALPLTVAAQAVQRSAYPNAYADDEATARLLLSQAKGVGTTAGTAAGTGVGTGVATGAGYESAGNEPAACHDGEAAGGRVRYPLPARSGYRDLRNWGGSGARWEHGHSGTDLSVGCGTPVLAATAGEVVVRSDQPWAGRWLVQVSTGPHHLATWYAHMRRLTVHDGDTVRAGQQIGDVGDLGNATGCHLHFEVHPRGGSIYLDNINPSDWLAANVGRNAGTVSAAQDGASAGAGAGPFTVSSFNVLGASHTGRNGKHPEMASGAARTAGIVAVIARHRVDIAGLQEFQGSQQRAFRRRVGGSFDLYSPPHTSSENTIIWRRSRFEAVQKASLSVPYFNGHRRPMPVLLLRHRPTGVEFWVADFHNPADTARYHHQGRWRAVATRLEGALANRLRGTGRRVIILGDMNEHRSYPHALTRSAGMHSAAPAGYRGIDWILGSPNVAFVRHTVDDSPLVDATTDHPVVIAEVAAP